MAARTTQAAVITVLQSPPANSRISQAALISVQGPANSPALITQAAVISVVQNNRKYVSLGDPIKLDCWQPCTAFGTHSLIIYIGG